MWQRVRVLGGTPSIGPVRSFGGGGGILARTSRAQQGLRHRQLHDVRVHSAELPHGAERWFGGICAGRADRFHDELQQPHRLAGRTSLAIRSRSVLEVGRTTTPATTRRSISAGRATCVDGRTGCDCAVLRITFDDLRSSEPAAEIGNVAYSRDCGAIRSRIRSGFARVGATPARGRQGGPRRSGARGGPSVGRRRAIIRRSRARAAGRALPAALRRTGRARCSRPFDDTTLLTLVRAAR